MIRVITLLTLRVTVWGQKSWDLQQEEDEEMMETASGLHNIFTVLIFLLCI